MVQGEGTWQDPDNCTYQVRGEEPITQVACQTGLGSVCVPTLHGLHI